LEQGADPTIVDESGQTYLHLAATRRRFNLLNTVEYVLNVTALFPNVFSKFSRVEERGRLLAQIDVAGYTCIHYAALPPTMVRPIIKL
jgi:ankyrin repeat protein